MNDDPTLPESLLPYDRWLEEAHRSVVINALDYLCQHGLPGEHHFYITFLTSYPGVEIPERLRERYPEEMTIVLQHQFHHPAINRKAGFFSVGLSFGGVLSTLRIPFKAISAFADPHMQLALRFSPPETLEDVEQDNLSEHSSPAELHHFSAPRDGEQSPSEEKPKEAEVVSLAAFRKENTPPNHNGSDE
ncbi:hypothetical protein GS501_09605 [Saccharibacter sp. 17.LH.SD]|uniref:SspB family protein n=1 Tax=Saccharibacter sp. 17.LH.SD TaxID=2689393 RepID=UPI001370CED6|nr:ClpXP protease specificity-enhancing factor SspB [Saccharibacter sp. 17.LH.SD]MXV45286.1 hypothetical protein [Saccharibacter sp. 17.LH.SD]